MVRGTFRRYIPEPKPLEGAAAAPASTARRPAPQETRA